jgi:general secretion pathway protein K
VSANRAPFARAQRGVAAIVAILIVALCASAATYLVSRYALALRHAENIMARAQADQLARAAVHWAASILANDDRKIDHAGELWAQPLPPIPAEDATVEGRIQDEQGKFNLNNLVRGGQASLIDVAIFERLLAEVDVSARLTDVLIDWIDADEEVTQPAGAESTTYLGMDPPYRTANMKLTDVGELLRLKGVDEEMLGKLLAHVTALPRETTININFATPELLRALAPNLSDSDSKSIVEERRKKPFDTTEAFLKRVPPDSAQSIKSLIDVKSDYFSAQGAVRRGRVVAGYRALLERRDRNWPLIIALTEEPL